MPAQSNDPLIPLRHSTAHVMAQAVGDLFPGARFGIGPAIQDGFYYDFELPRPLTPEDLAQIEARMREIVGADRPFVRAEISPAEGQQLFREQPFKLELIADLQAGRADEDGETVAGPVTLSTYTQDTFVDLCRGPHLERTGQIPADGFKLLEIAGAYWRGDEKREMLTRIYGTVFDSSRALADHLAMLEEARKRDHRKLGPELGLFTTGNEGGCGLIYWLPNGTIVREELENLWKAAHRRNGYNLVSTPHIAPASLWETSGHCSYYRDNMYFMPVDETEYVLKPMNCPGHILIYKSEKRSYRELPFRLAELGTVYRYEKSGVLHGLMRVRGFTVDDGHIFCTPDQIVDEIRKVVSFALYFLRVFGFGYAIELSLSDPDDMGHYAGSPEMWARVEPALADALDGMGEKYRTVRGEAAFYGPKIDIKLRDALGRYWQGPTIQFDFNIPERFDLTYTGPDGGEHRVFMVHRALFGSIERFTGNLIEHFAGNFPGWLAPLQVVILPLTGKQHERAAEVCGMLADRGFRCSLDRRNETIGYRIRAAESRKVPMMLVIGEREADSGRVAVRAHGRGDLGVFDLEEAVGLIGEACRRPALPEGGRSLSEIP